MSALRPCYLSQILIDEQADQQVIFVTEQGGARRIPIVIGPLEAMAIDRAVKGQRFERPLTHDLFVSLMTATRHRCREVRIIDLKAGTFFAQLVLLGDDGREIALDCRPSDAIALMVRLPDTVLLVAEDVLAEAGS
jgi:bifunctional DNase/RNase